MFILLAITALWFYVVYCYKELSYWEKKHVPYIRPFTPFGNAWKSFLCINNFGEVLRDYYDKFKNNNHKFGGIYIGLGPVFLPINVDLIKRILIIDFEYFGSRTVYNKYFPFYENLYCMGYSEWKQIRPKFAGQYFPEKLKILHNLIYTIAKDMTQIIKNNRSESLNMTNLAQRYTLDVIQEWFTGTNENNLHKTDTEAQRILPKLMKCTTKDILLTFYREGVRNPGAFLKALLTNADVIKYFTKVAVNESKPFKAKGYHSNAFMNNLITVIYNKSRHHVNYIEIASHLCSLYCNILNSIPFNLAMCLYCLGNDQYLQDNVRREVIDEMQRNNKKSKYKSMCNLKLLEGTIFGN